MRRSHTTLVALAIVPTMAYAAQVYEWRDASGKRYFSDKPPAGVDARPIGINTRSPRANTPPAGGAMQKTEDAPKTWAEKNDDFSKRRAEQQADSAKAREEAEQENRRKAACESARNQLKVLESGVRVQRLNERGERVVLDDAGRNEEMARARDNIKHACQE
ncbi:MAG: DUF4124 domain-containing protein [Rhodocyclaceae bacterium]|nr:DUF4124 domain-containing protein [Rhodocyclaceae bacterium]MCB1962473.1 DUF4124 domain-containing protein [Rhodocyclaceae bacterium]